MGASDLFRAAVKFLHGIVIGIIRFCMYVALRLLCLFVTQHGFCAFSDWPKAVSFLTRVNCTDVSTVRPFHSTILTGSPGAMTKFSSTQNSGCL